MDFNYIRNILILEIININEERYLILLFLNIFLIFQHNLYFCFVLSIFNIFKFFQLKFILYTLLLGCIASDIGGFYIGKLLKGPKITKISPNKTYSGSHWIYIFHVCNFHQSFTFL